MFKFVKYDKVKTEFTTHEFRGGDDTVKVNHFDVDIVSIESTNVADIDALIAQQQSEINCVEITQAEFKTLVKDSAQLNRIREVVKTEIAKKYDIADEVALTKRASTDNKRVVYESYVQSCLSIGTDLKSKVGY